MITAIIFVLLITFGIGLPLTLWIAPKHNVAGRFGLSYLLGIGFFTLLMYITNLLGLKLTFLNNVLIFLVFSLPLAFFKRSKIEDFWKETVKSVKNFHPGLVEKIILGAIGFFIISSFINTFYWPVYRWDALTLYDFRALVISQTGFIKSALSALGEGFNFVYPLLTSLSHTIVYLSGGNNSQFLYSMFYLSLGLVFYGLLREFTSRNLSLIFTLVLLSVPKVFTQSIISYTNLPYMAYFSLGAIYFYVWDKKRTMGYLVLSSVLVGLSVWTRSAEPFWLVIFGTIILASIFRRKIFDIIIFSLIFFPIQQVWQNFRISAGSASSTIGEITNSVPFLANIFNFPRWIEVLNFLYKNVALSWGPVFLLFSAAFIYSLIFKKIKKSFLIYFLTFSLLAMLILGTFIFSFSAKGWAEIPDSAVRLSMIFYPLLIYSAALVLIDHTKYEK